MFESCHAFLLILHTVTLMCSVMLYALLELSFVILFSRTQPLHFENCLIIKTKWEIYDLWRKKKISICKYEIMINPSFISATQTSCQGVLEELQLGCAYTKYFPSCCLQVYLIRGVCHVSHFFFLGIYAWYLTLISILFMSIYLSIYFSFWFCFLLSTKK